MFKLEKEMIPVLRKGLSEIYNTNYFVEEFFSGNGKADIVFTQEIQLDKVVDFDFEQTFYLTCFLFTIKGRFTTNDLIKRYNLKEIKLQPLLNYLMINDYIYICDGYFKVKKKFSPPAKKLIAVEAKLKNWKEGFYQAQRYKHFSHKSFLALSNDYINNVDIKLLKEKKIGLISVSTEKINIIYNPPIETPLDVTAFYFLSSEFVKNLTA